ncbi:MAG: NAD-dependent epimerase/dehydratase family protein [Planctomycetota bacterium]|jgi:nucleoside-diphosphate-sugar epimerase
MRILVTGAAGFIGSHLCEGLADLGHQVLGLDRYADYYARSLKEENASDLAERGVDVVSLDLAEDDLAAAVDGVNVIYHCAAQPGIDAATSFDEFLRDNVVATQRLAEAATGSKSLVGFVNISTSSVYGEVATESEQAVPMPTSRYGVTKLAAEQLVLSYQRSKGLPACSTRLFSVYGPRERPEKLYPRLIRAILRDEPFPLYEGSRSHSRSFTYVADIVAGLMSVLDHLEACQGEIFNIGSDIEITTGEGIEIVEEIIGRSARIEVQPPRHGDQLRTHADITKARQVLGYSPETTPQEGLRAEVEWYKSRILGRFDA